MKCQDCGIEVEYPRDGRCGKCIEKAYLPRTSPALRTFAFQTIVVGDDAEVIALLTQVMEAYPNANHAAIGEWFHSHFSANTPLKP